MTGAVLAGGSALSAIGVVAVLLAAHPFGTYPLSLHLLPPRPIRANRTHGRTLRAALCVCAYNEARVIRAKAENMLAMREAMPGLELLVYVDAATDGTAEILRELEPDIRVVVSPHRRGKTYGMNTLIAMTKADVIVFSDANVTFARGAIPKLLASFADPEVGAVCGHLRYTGPDGSATAGIGSLYWRLEEHIKALESRTGSCMGADGSIFAIRRALHESPPPDLIDDMYVSLAILSAGWRVVRASEAHAWEELVSRPDEEFRRKIRIGCQAFNVHRTLWPRLRRLSAVDLYKYVSHKLLRWLAIYLVTFGGAALLAGLAVLDLQVAGWCALAGFTPLGGAMLAPSGKLAALRDIILALVATGVGVWCSLRGDRFQTWSPPASARASRPGARAEAP